MDQVIQDFFIHPQSRENLQTSVEKVNGIPAIYTFEWHTDNYNPSYKLTTIVEASSIDEAQQIAGIINIVKMGVSIYDHIYLNLIKIENKIYQGVRQTIS